MIKAPVKGSFLRAVLKNALLGNEGEVLFISGFICDDLASVALVVK